MIIFKQQIPKIWQCNCQIEFIFTHLKKHQGKKCYVIAQGSWHWVSVKILFSWFARFFNLVDHWILKFSAVACTRQWAKTPGISKKRDRPSSFKLPSWKIRPLNCQQTKLYLLDVIFQTIAPWYICLTKIHHILVKKSHSSK